MDLEFTGPVFLKGVVWGLPGIITTPSSLVSGGWDPEYKHTKWFLNKH